MEMKWKWMEMCLFISPFPTQLMEEKATYPVTILCEKCYMDANSLAVGLSGALRTGNYVVDMILTSLVVMFVPILLNVSTKYMKSIIKVLHDCFMMRFSKTSVCDLSFTVTVNDNGLTWPHPNDMIVGAVLEKILQEMDMSGTKHSDMQWFKMTTLQTENPDNPIMNATQNAMNRTKLIRLPYDNQFLRVRGDIWFQYSKEYSMAPGRSDMTRTSGATSMCLTRLILKCNGKDSRLRLEEFVNEAMDAYKKAATSKSIEKRELFMLDRYAQGTMMFTSYPLDDSKCFDSVFLAQKDDILNIIQDFSTRSGRFGRPGCPHRLGIMLHGPPGTGKTSVIRAIASLLKRNIMFVDLCKLRTNNDLMTVMFGKKFDVPNSVAKVAHVTQSNTLYAFEDIDCSSELVLRREYQRDDLTDSDGDTDDDGQCGRRDGKKSNKKSEVSCEDRLTLAGLLNAISGIMDVPGRVIIMTSNHYDKLDPALIRPGRINLNIYLGFVTLEVALQMLKSLMDIDLCDTEVQDYVLFTEAFTKHRLNKWCTPAKFETMCISSGSLESLISSFALSSVVE